MVKPRILIVDDETIIRDAIRRWFEFADFEVDVAEDGQVAVDKCSAHTYDIVTMDLEMPRMKGMEAIALIRKQHPALPVIIVTGYYEENAIDTDKYRIAKVLTKPVRLQDLETEVRKVLNEQGQ